jgi:hypothetical protein
MVIKKLYLCWCIALLTAALWKGAFAQNQPAEGYKESDLIRVPQCDAAKGEKAITCKRLAVYGSEKCVPVVAPLLADEELASWARIALEAIPCPAADTALRDAASELKKHVKLRLKTVADIVEAKRARLSLVWIEVSVFSLFVYEKSGLWKA